MAYWLMKSEPTVFSIDDLAQVPSEPWNGVRHYQARNYLRDDIKVDDLAFFYHSNCPYPAIVGLMRVVKAGYADETALDPSDPGFDPKSSRDNPRWYQVDVAFVEKLTHPVLLTTLKKQPELAAMPLVKRGNRLSIMPVTPEQWQLILTLAAADTSHYPQ